MAAVNDDASGTYTCTPYNSYGTMGSSGPTDVILKVSARSQLSQYRNRTLQKGQLCPLVACFLRGEPRIIIKSPPQDVENVTLYVSTPTVHVF